MIRILIKDKLMILMLNCQSLRTRCRNFCGQLPQNPVNSLNTCNRAVDRLVVRTSDSRPEKAWVQCQQIPSKYVLIKSVGTKVLRAVTAETTGTGGWRIFPPLQFHA
ncbi:hypothetical protein TNCV_3989671 [Trichonephila clavipes]|uniref:Uncharacterized protein n=1 Tax=Trichonephila clavipes TaxID=2585209 RepID=A0A8X6T0C0_TRICX|nr:hypothetical protein TNCV_3989671 [Trichonephila clavipes]